MLKRKKSFTNILLILFIPFLSEGQNRLMKQWELAKIINIEANTNLFADAHETSTLVFTDSTFYGRATCNTLFGKYSVGAEEIKFLDIGTTLVGCDGTREEMENLLNKTLREVNSYHLYSDTLILTDNKKIKLLYISKE
jgi:heat shock protein HslJ